ncbi:MAG: hypothetical protein J6A69_00600 [Clostridia bacterium]|nr:hypothetical protein [Clostridia bacterium]
MKLLKCCLIALLITTLIPVSCFAVAVDLWIDDGALDRIYGKGQVIESTAVENSDILSELLFRISVLPTDKYDFSKEAKLDDFVDAVAHILGLSAEDNNFEQLKNAGFLNLNNKVDKLTFDTAIYTSINLTGYNHEAKVNGGYPHGYYITAKYNGLLYNLKYRANQPMTNGEMIQLLYNTISINVNETESTGEVKYGKPILESRFDTVLKKGVLTGSSFTNMYPIVTLFENQASIDQSIYKANTEELLEYVGMSVNAFVTTRADGKYIILARPDDNINQIAEFESDSIYSCGEGYMEITDDVDSKRFEIANDARVMYNGKYSGSVNIDELEDYKNKDASFKFIDNDCDGLIDVITILEFEHFIAKNNVGTSNRLQFKYGLSYRDKSFLNLDEDNTDLRVYLSGKPASISDIKKDMVVSVARSKNTVGKQYMRIELSTTKISSGIDAVDFEYSIPSVLMNNETYKLTKTYSLAGGNSNNTPVNDEIVALEPGGFYEFYLTFDGKIADATRKQTSNKFGCLLTWGKENRLDSQIQLKIFDEDGVMNIYTLDDKVVIYNSQNLQGKTVTKEKAEELLPNQNLSDPRVMIQFSANEAGKIKELYLETDNTTNGPGTMDYPLSKDILVSGDIFYYQEMLEARYRAHSDMKIFFIPAPENRKNDKEYSVVEVDDYGNQHYYSNMYLYGVDDYLIPEFGVCQAQGAGSDIFSNSSSAVVEKLVSAVDKEGMPTVKINHFINGARSSVMVSDQDITSSVQSGWYSNVKVTDLKLGDVIQFETNSEGKLTRFRVIYKADAPGTYRIQNDAGTELTQLDQPYGFGLFYGKAVGIKEDILMYKFERSDMVNEPQRVLNSTFCYLISEGKIKISSLEEILPEDKLVTRIGWPGAMEIYIYR